MVSKPGMETRKQHIEVMKSPEYKSLGRMETHHGTAEGCHNGTLSLSLQAFCKAG